MVIKLHNLCSGLTVYFIQCSQEQHRLQELLQVEKQFIHYHGIHPKESGVEHSSGRMITYHVNP